MMPGGTIPKSPSTSGGSMRGADKIAKQAVTPSGTGGISGRLAPTELGPSKPPVRNVARGAGIPGMIVKSAKIASHAESVVAGAPWSAVVAFALGPGGVPRIVIRAVPLVGSEGRLALPAMEPSRPTRRVTCGMRVIVMDVESA